MANKSNETKSPSTLALYPNGVGFGYAFFLDQQTPIDCGVIPVKPLSNRKLLMKMKHFMELYEPEVVVLKKPCGIGNSRKRVRKLIDDVVSVALASAYPVKKYSRKEIRYAFEQFKCETKMDIASKIVQVMPQFKDRLPKLRKPWMAEGYHMGMFDAISLAMTHFYLEK
jgi:hypothetical protein